MGAEHTNGANGKVQMEDTETTAPSRRWQRLTGREEKAPMAYRWAERIGIASVLCIMLAGMLSGVLYWNRKEASEAHDKFNDALLRLAIASEKQAAATAANTAAMERVGTALQSNSERLLELEKEHRGRGR